MKLRFSIRELILVTIIIGMAIGWWLDHNQRWQRALSPRYSVELWRDQEVLVDGDVKRAWEREGAGWKEIPGFVYR